jgi:hypothetical protein
MQQCQLIFTQFLLPCFDPNEWCMKNGLHSGGLNPRPLVMSYLPKQLDLLLALYNNTCYCFSKQKLDQIDGKLLT